MSDPLRIFDPDSPADGFDETESRGGRDHIADGGRSIADWLVWDWTVRTDDRLDGTAAEVFDLADRVHQLTVTVLVTMLVMVVALAVLIAMALL
jgi:hypothetical protein